MLVARGRLVAHAGGAWAALWRLVADAGWMQPAL
jgi:hypothetical protein